MVESEARRRGQQRQHHLSDCQRLEAWRRDHKTAAEQVVLELGFDQNAAARSVEMVIVKGHYMHKSGGQIKVSQPMRASTQPCVSEQEK